MWPEFRKLKFTAHFFLHSWSGLSVQSHTFCFCSVDCNSFLYLIIICINENEYIWVRATKWKWNSITYQFLFFLFPFRFLHSHFHQLILKTFISFETSSSKLTKRRRRRWWNSKYSTDTYYTQLQIYVYCTGEEKEKNVAMNSKADVFLFNSILCPILCIYSLMPLFSLPFHVFLFLVVFSVSYGVCVWAFSADARSLSLISHFNSFLRLVHCLDSTCLMLYIFFSFAFPFLYSFSFARFHTLVM